MSDGLVGWSWRLSWSERVWENHGGILSRRVWSCWLLIPDGLRVWCDELRLYLGQLYQPPLRRPASAELFQSCGFSMSSANIWKTSPWKGHESAMGPLYKLRIASRCWCCWKGTASPTSSCRAPPDFSTHIYAYASVANSKSLNGPNAFLPSCSVSQISP